MRHSATSGERGGVKLGCAIAAGAVVLVALFAGSALVGRYNGLVTRQEKVEATWSEIDPAGRGASNANPT